MELAGKVWLLTDAVGSRTTLAHDHLAHGHLLMEGMKRPIHPAALAAGYALDRLGTGQIARVLPSRHRAIYPPLVRAMAPPGNLC
jgi:hypothetical protein